MTLLKGCIPFFMFYKMKKKKLFLLLAITVLASCRTVTNKGSAGKNDGETADVIDTVILDPVSDRPLLHLQPDGSWIWIGLGSERINRVWIGRVCHDTLEHKWRWSIPDAAVQKIGKKDREMIDSILNNLNTK